MSSLDRINKRIEQHQKWIQSGEQFRTQQLSYISQAIEDPTLTSLTLLATWMDYLGLFYGTRGVVTLVDKAGAQGWSDLAAASCCYGWSVKLEISSYYSWYEPLRAERVAFLLSSLPTAVTLFCGAISRRDVHQEQELWTLLQKPLLDCELRVSNWWYERHFEPFFVSLYAKIKDLSVPFSLERCDFGVFGPILDRWEDDQAIAAALRKVCDYHCEVMFGTEEDRDSEFDRPPLDLIPVEVYAVNRLRTESGLRPVEVDHPLMRVIGTIVPTTPPAELTEILSRVEAKHGEFFRK